MTAFPTNTASRTDQSSRMEAQVILSSALRQICETPNASGLVITGLWLCNGGSTRTTVRVHHVQQKDTPAQRNALLYDLLLAPYSVTIVDSEIPMVAGEMLYASASVANAVTMTIYSRRAT